MIPLPQGNVKVSGWLRLRPTLNQAKVGQNGKPTPVSRGIYDGYSLPLYALDEELFYQTTIPSRWDGINNPKVYLKCWLADTGNSVGDKFKLEIHSKCINFETSTDSIPDTYDTTTVETTLVTGKTVQYSPYVVSYDMDATQLLDDCLRVAAIRRVAASSDEITGELVVSDIIARFPVDKIYGDM